ncbi:hypothetical protein EJ02DRAFT_237852 [Clathrospora elynae]|uniref:Uncharacterized protein n=1 Tax=Clathrospora elynae TaxID=706981 RepID=A0A6A5SNL7_9PLEO|nr:hypothetical protein EJ02DRAFT_237852 [Clathrospora elynae]
MYGSFLVRSSFRPWIHLLQCASRCSLGICREGCSTLLSGDGGNRLYRNTCACGAGSCCFLLLALKLAFALRSVHVTISRL